MKNPIVHIEKRGDLVKARFLNGAVLIISKASLKEAERLAVKK